MKLNPLQQLPEKKQGAIFFLCGIALLILYAFGIIQKSIALAVIIISIAAIILGFHKLGVFHKIAQKLHHK